MNVDVKKIGPCRRALKIEADEDAVSKEYKAILNDYVANASLPGFRKGRAPVPMVEKRFAKDLSDDAKQRVVAKAYHDAVGREELSVVAVVDMDEAEFDPKRGFEFTVTVDVDPEFKLPNYEGIKIVAQKTDPSEEEIDQAIERLLENYASYEDVDDRSVQRDDMVKVDYSATVDGKPLQEVSPESESVGEKEDYWLLVNQNAFLPEMEEGLIGCRIGEETDVAVAYPSDFSDKTLAGMKAQYHVKIKALRAKKIPELSEEILERLGVDSVEELRAKISEGMRESGEEREKSRQRDEVCSHLIKKTKMDVPESRVQEVANSLIDNIVRRKMGQGDSQEKIQSERDEILKEALQLATERVKLDYILDRISEQEQVEVSDEDLEDFLSEEAAKYGMTPERFKEAMQERSSPEKMKEALRSSKTVDLLLGKAAVK